MRALTTLVLLLSLSAPAAAAGALEIIPSIGFGKPTGKGSDVFDMALGLGVAAGVRTSPSFSLSGQVGYQIMSVENEPDEFSMSMIRLQAIPAFHLVQGAVDFSVGPTIGMFFMQASYDPVMRSATVRGLELGLTTSLMFAASPQISLGPTLSYARLFATRACLKEGSTEMCDGDPDNDEEGFFSLMFSMRF